MPRDLPIANGRLLVNFDSSYTLRDIYWPHIGEQNHTLGDLNRTGVWVDGQFAWFGDDGWTRDLRYMPDTLVTNVTLTHAGLKLKLVCSDAVDFDRDVMLRRFRISNLADKPRDIRLFTHHNWHIWENVGANTVLYRPDHKVLVAYKRHFVAIINGVTGGETAGAPAATREGALGVYHWATGKKEIDGQEGTWRDAEDGELSGNPIAQGSVDSVAGFDAGTVPAGEDRLVYQWVTLAETFQDALKLDDAVRSRGPESYLTRTENYWRAWVRAKPLGHADLSDEQYELYCRSLLLLRAQTDHDGAIIAATDADVYTFSADTYAYMWPRDGALVATALSHAGYGDITASFFYFCRKVITPGGYLMHKYTPSGALASSWHPWMDVNGQLQLPIQEDETALVLFALWQHFSIFQQVELVRPFYRPLVKAAADFMTDFREPHTKLPAPSWDLWEERHGIHAYTVAAVYAGLQAAANFANLFGETDLAEKYDTAASEIKTAARAYLWHEGEQRFLRMINVNEIGQITPDMTFDSAVAGIFKFGLFDAGSAEVASTMQAYEKRLSAHTSVGGISRYENDYYHQVTHDLSQATGNPWFISSLWLAQYYIARAQTTKDLAPARNWLEWTRTHALASGVLAEQIDPLTGAPLSVSPLTWSHAEYVSTVRWYVAKYEELTRPNGKKK